MPDLAPAYGSDAGREVIWEGAADGAAGLIEEIRENSMASTCFCCPSYYHGPGRIGIAGVIDPETGILLLILAWSGRRHYCGVC